MIDLGHWTTKIDDIPETFFGFIYKITNKKTNRSYIGKKQAQTIRKMKPLKGKKLGRRKVVDTDWKTYTGSSPELNQDISELGEDNFLFEIIRFCTCKWELSYYEAAEQFKNEVLLKPSEYYNGIINLRINRPPKATLEQYESLCNRNQKPDNN
jgi:Putative endonuclease segE, GIY-YIG domain